MNRGGEGMRGYLWDRGGERGALVLRVYSRHSWQRGESCKLDSSYNSLPSDHHCNPLILPRFLFSSVMDGQGGGGQYSNSSRQHLFRQSPQLPPPSQLHLQSSNNSGFNRSNTLPPIANLPQSNHHPSHSHSRSNYPYPSSSSGNNGTHLPPLPSPSWGPANHHRTSSSRDELHPSQNPHSHHQHHSQQQHSQAPAYHRSDSGRTEPAVKRETLPAQMHHQPSQSQGSAKEQEDGMPATSDFVKKLFK